jgi:PEP-CTERM motif-containing protein
MNSARVQSNLVMLLLVVTAILCTAFPAWSATVGSFFLTGHDPDFHATDGNTVGAQHINQRAISFVTDPAFNPFVAAGINKFLFVEDTTIGIPGGHLSGTAGLVASGFVPGVNFDVAGSALVLDGLLRGGALGTSYDAIVIGSDFGGLLTQPELDVLNADSAIIISFLNAGGGLYAMSECNNPLVAPCLTNHGAFGYLPFLVTTNPVGEAEGGNTLTPFGLSLGLANPDINGNFSHSVFVATGGLNIVDTDPGGEILSIGGRGRVSGGGISVPEPSALLLLSSGLATLAGLARRRHRKQ